MENGRKFPLNSLLRAARERRSLTQQELAECIGTTFVNISRWENGTTFPSPYYRQKLCEFFGKSLAQLGLVPPAPSSPRRTLSAPLPRVSRIWNIPYTRNPFFTGREDLLILLHKRLSTERTAALTQAQALFGLGGIGKTQTAVEYAFRYGDDYDAVYWIRAAMRETLVADFLALAQQLDLPQQADQGQQRVITAVKDWLTAHAGWLLIFDNADDLPLAQEFLPSDHNGYILYTTRAQAAGAIAASVEVEQLNTRDGMLLLLHCAKLLDMHMPLEQARAADRAVAECIVKEMDGLPLAIAQAGAYVDETGCHLADYLGIYATHRKAMLSRRSRLLRDYPETVATTWSLSFQQIEEENPAAAELLRLCAFLAPDAIPENLLIHGATALGADLRATAVDALAFNEALGVLRRYSLVRRSADTNMLSIHRLVQAVLKDNMDQATQCAWAERAIRVVNAAFPEANYSTGAGLEAINQDYLPHVQECAALITQYQLAFPEAADLLYKAGAYLYYHGFHLQSQALHEQALVIRKQVFGPAQPVVAQSLNFLAILARLQDNYPQAEAYHQQALTIRQNVLGLEHPDTAESLNNLGVLYLNQEKYDQAEPPLQQALKIREQALGFNALDTLTTSINLVKLYLGWRKYEQAELLLNQLLETGERIFGSEHSLVAQTLNLLGRLSYERGNYEQAETFWKQSLAISEKMRGPENLVVAERLSNLAELALAQSDYKQARSLCQRAINICEKLVGAEYPDTITYRKLLSKIEREQNGDDHQTVPSLY
jgi:transcriptional regulator with XRE-family HTH domain